MTTKMIVTGITVVAAVAMPGHVPPRAPSGPVAAPACRADQIGPIPAIHQGVAGGSAGWTVTISRRSTSTCRLDAYPVLWHTEPGHLPVLVPTQRGSNDGHVVLAPGEQGVALFSRTDGGVYPPSARECAHPQRYHGLAMGIGGRRFSLPGVIMDVPCGTVSAQWL